MTDLLTLVNAVSLVTESDPDRAGHADRLLALVVTGVRYRDQRR
jgi:transcriptional regulator SbtR-like protein